MLRDLRRADGRQFFALMEAGFPEESAVLGNRPEEFERVFQRVFRWDARLLLAFLTWLGRPIVRALVVESDGRVVATTLVTFPRGAAYVSNVVVDAAYRRRGLARRMLEEAYRSAQRARRKYIVLDVLDSNEGARALYDSLGYRPLRQRSEVRMDSMDRFAAPLAKTVRSGRCAGRMFPAWSSSFDSSLLPRSRRCCRRAKGGSSRAGS